MTEKTVFYADYQTFTEAKKRIAEGEAESQGTTIKCHECDGARALPSMTPAPQEGANPTPLFLKNY